MCVCVCMCSRMSVVRVRPVMATRDQFRREQAHRRLQPNTCGLFHFAKNTTPPVRAHYPLQIPLVSFVYVEWRCAVSHTQIGESQFGFFLLRGGHFRGMLSGTDFISIECMTYCIHMVAGGSGQRTASVKRYCSLGFFEARNTVVYVQMVQKLVHIYLFIY